MAFASTLPLNVPASGCGARFCRRKLGEHRDNAGTDIGTPDAELRAGLHLSVLYVGAAVGRSSAKHIRTTVFGAAPTFTDGPADTVRCGSPRRSCIDLGRGSSARRPLGSRWSEEPPVTDPAWCHRH